MDSWAPERNKTYEVQNLELFLVILTPIGGFEIELNGNIKRSSPLDLIPEVHGHVAEVNVPRPFEGMTSFQLVNARISYRLNAA